MPVETGEIAGLNRTLRNRAVNGGVQNTTAMGQIDAPTAKTGLRKAIRQRAGLLKDYGAAISGSAGRLVFSLVYFVALANTLTIAEFGLFAAASASGVVLSRIVGFGFITTLYRIATVRSRLLGTFAAGFIALMAASLPVVALAAAATYAMLFAGQMSMVAFGLIVAAECVLWRPTEAVAIINNGLGRFGRASTLVIISTSFRAIAALALMFGPWKDLDHWAWLYLGANAAALALTLGLFLPAMRLRFRPALYWRRLADSLYVASAEILLYLQMELDKLLVLSFGGAHLAGIYAIVMRLVDLTAIPIRSFTMLLTQKLMRAPALLASVRRRFGVEVAVLAVSTAALGSLALILHFFPNLLGSNVAEAAPLLMLALMIPGLRNLAEYQAELLFARGQTFIRAVNQALIGAAKAVLLIVAIQHATSEAEFIYSLNLVFAVLYLVSAILTYTAMRRPAKAL